MKKINLEVTIIQETWASIKVFYELTWGRQGPHREITGHTKKQKQSGVCYSVQILLSFEVLVLWNALLHPLPKNQKVSFYNFICISLPDGLLTHKSRYQKQVLNSKISFTTLYSGWKLIKSHGFCVMWQWNTQELVNLQQTERFFLQI